MSSVFRLAGIVVLLQCAVTAEFARAADVPLPEKPTFSRDIAPLMYQHCSACHRPGAAGPFDLLTYDDLHRHLKQSLKVIEARVMPPWLAESGFGEFSGDRRLDERAIALFQKWAAQGAPEGDASELPAAPAAAGEWTLGKPDLVLKAAKAYSLSAEGNDVYWNFVLPTGLDARRYVRAVELHSGNARVVHHGFLYMDSSGTAKRRSDKAGGAGFEGMETGEDTFAPEGQNISWQPGKETCIRTEESPWLLPADADLLLQVHLRRRGKVEEVQPEIGLYFTDKSPSLLLFRITLRSTSIDIPAGASDYAIASNYTLPVDVEALSISAHAHYLGKEVHGYAKLPDGKQVELLKISRWNFNMQDSYTFKSPLPLPAGAKIQMRWEFDNSDRNAANPSSRPRRVQYGVNSTDEMGELSIQLQVKNRMEYEILSADFMRNWLWPDAVEFQENRLKHNPADARPEVALAKLYMQVGRQQEMATHLNAAFKIDPNCPQANYVMGHLLVQRRDYANAADRYRRCLEEDPDNFRAQSDLALVLGLMGKLPESVEQFTSALKLNPRGSLIHANLGKVYAIQGKLREARTEIETALRLDPDQPIARGALKSLEMMEKRSPP